MRGEQGWQLTNQRPGDWGGLCSRQALHDTLTKCHFPFRETIYKSFSRNLRIHSWPEAKTQFVELFKRSIVRFQVHFDQTVKVKILCRKILRPKYTKIVLTDLFRKLLNRVFASGQLCIGISSSLWPGIVLLLLQQLSLCLWHWPDCLLGPQLCLLATDNLPGSVFDSIIIRWHPDPASFNNTQILKCQSS